MKREIALGTKELVVGRCCYYYSIVVRMEEVLFAKLKLEIYSLLGNLKQDKKKKGGKKG